jgi:hypothetical protein
MATVCELRFPCRNGKGSPAGRGDAFPFRSEDPASILARMLADFPGSRPSGDPDAVEALAKAARREAALLHAIEITDTGSWRGFGADMAMDRIRMTDVDLSTVVNDLRTLAVTLDRMADDLRHDQRAWDRTREDHERDERNQHHAPAS